MFQEVLAQPYIMFTIIALYSLCIGSLLNVFIHRLPLMLHAEWEKECCELLKIDKTQNSKINLFFPRSFCPQCKSTLKFWQNIPLISFLCLRGKCFSCKTVIPYRYPLVELLTMGLSLQTWWMFGPTIKCLLLLLIIWILIILFFIDLDHQILPDSLTLSLLWIGLIANCYEIFIPLKEAVLSAAGAYLFLWLIIKVFYWISGKIGMGNGDFKLFAALAAITGWKMLPVILLISSTIGSIIGIVYIYLFDKSRDTCIPYGPFLCIGGYIALFWGSSLIKWYINFW